jgi:nitrogenase-associated protein
MPKIVFYEKPGCINGGKQKAILEAAGHSLECKNILTEPWTKERLLAFCADKPATEIMNHTAPAIKNGEITPAELSAEEALSLMVADPILIKRPLIEVVGLNIQGFNNSLLQPYLGNWNNRDDVTTCPNLNTSSCDEKKELA